MLPVEFEAVHKYQYVNLVKIENVAKYTFNTSIYLAKSAAIQPERPRTSLLYE
jgi:hypothetical protein